MNQIGRQFKVMMRDSRTKLGGAKAPIVMKQHSIRKPVAWGLYDLLISRVDKIDNSKIVDSPHLLLPEGGVRFIPSLVWTTPILDKDSPITPLTFLTYTNLYFHPSMDGGRLD